MSGHSMTARVRQLLTDGCLPLPSWFWVTARWMSETMARVFLTSLRMSEKVSCVLLGKGGGSDTPGALDAKVRP